MRILQICNRIPYPPHDGGAIAMLNMTKGFSKLGVELHLLCLNTKKHYFDPNSLPALFQDLASFETVEIDTDVKPVQAAMNLLFTRKSYNISRFYSKQFEKELIKTLKANTFDIVHLEGLHICVYLNAIRKHGGGAKICLRAHNLEYVIWERLAENETNPLKRFYLKSLAKRLFDFEVKTAKNVDALVPITETDAEIFREMSPNIPVFVSPAGLDLEAYTINATKQEWPGIFHLGALNWMPNIEALQWFLKEVWPRLHKEYPKLKFHVAGRNMPAWLNDLKTVGVEAHGEVANAIDFMNSKTIMIAPLLSGSGMRIKIIEGMALGKTIVSTTIGAEGIPYEDQKNILIADTPDAFYLALKKCIQNQESAKKIGKNARKFAEENFSNEVLVGKLVGFYERISA